MSALVIRHAQMDALREAHKRRGYRRLVPVYQRECPDLCAGQTPGELLDTVAWAIEKAASHGLLEGAARRYVPFVLKYGRDFEQRDEFAWAADILRDRDLVGPQMMDRLEDEAPEF